MKYPIDAKFRAWRAHARQAIVAASGKGKLAFRWTLSVEKARTTFNDLAYDGEDFDSLELKVTASISAIAVREFSQTLDH